MVVKENYFTELASIDMSQYTEQKGKFTYLSWAHAVDQMSRFDPNWSWKVLRFPFNGIEVPYLTTPNGTLVEVEVTVNGRTLSQLQPVMDFKNKSMSNPDVMDINKAIQRCLVKAIALHGLGLYIYAGEDLPNELLSGVQSKLIAEKIETFARLRGAANDKVLKALGVPSINHLTIQQADIVIDKLTSWIDKAEQENAQAANDKVEDKEEPVEQAELGEAANA